MVPEVTDLHVCVSLCFVAVLRMSLGTTTLCKGTGDDEQDALCNGTVDDEQDPTVSTSHLTTLVIQSCLAVHWPC